MIKRKHLTVSSPPLLIKNIIFSQNVHYFIIFSFSFFILIKDNFFFFFFFNLKERKRKRLTVPPNQFSKILLQPSSEKASTRDCQTHLIIINPSQRLQF
jgi:hypothetical protein